MADHPPPRCHTPRRRERHTPHSCSAFWRRSGPCARHMSRTARTTASLASSRCHTSRPRTSIIATPVPSSTSARADTSNRSGGTLPLIAEAFADGRTPQCGQRPSSSAAAHAPHIHRSSSGPHNLRTVTRRRIGPGGGGAPPRSAPIVSDSLGDFLGDFLGEVPGSVTRGGEASTSMPDSAPRLRYSLPEVEPDLQVSAVGAGVHA